MTYSDILRLIFFDKISYCNSRFVTCIKINNASFYNLMFDHGHVHPTSALSSITFDNYAINQWNNPTETHFYSCAFLFGDAGIMGSNIYTHAVSFSNCLNGIVINFTVNRIWKSVFSSVSEAVFYWVFPTCRFAINQIGYQSQCPYFFRSDSLKQN